MTGPEHRMWVTSEGDAYVTGFKRCPGRSTVSRGRLRIPIVITSSGIMISDSGHRDHPP